MSVWNNKNQDTLKLKLQHTEELAHIQSQHNAELAYIQSQHKAELQKLQKLYEAKISRLESESDRRLIAQQREINVLQNDLQTCDTHGITVLNHYLNSFYQKVFTLSLEGTEIIRISHVIKELLGFEITQDMLIKNLGKTIAYGFGPTIDYCHIIKNGERISIREYTRSDLKKMISLCLDWYEYNKENLHLIVEGAKTQIIEALNVQNIPDISNIIISYLYF